MTVMKILILQMLKLLAIVLVRMILIEILMWCHRPGESRGRRSGWTARQRRPRRTGREGQSHVKGDVTGDDDKDNDGSFYHAC